MSKNIVPSVTISSLDNCLTISENDLPSPISSSSKALSSSDNESKISSFVIIQMANIINADDMFDIWTDMEINVTRINRGAPKDINLFSKALNNAGTPMPKNDFERLRKILKNL